MDIKAHIESLLDKLKSDKDLQGQFFNDPIATAEKLLGIDLPQEQLRQVAEAVKAKLDLDKAGDFIGGLFGKK